MRRGEGLTYGLSLLWLLLFFAGFGYFFIATPKYSDDIWYLQGWGQWFVEQGVELPSDGVNVFTAPIPADKVKETVLSHMDFDNVRLSNIIGFHFLFPPKWVGSSLALMAWFAAVFGIFRLSGVSMRQSRFLPLAIFLLTFVMPWHEFMGSIIFQFNYVLPSALSLCTLWLMLERPEGRAGQTGLFMLALITGCWHEGFGFPMLCSGALVAACYRRCRTRWMWLVLAGLTLSMFWHFGYLSPTFGRATNQRWMNYDAERLLTGLIRYKGIWVGVAATAVFIARRGFRQFISHPEYLYLWSSAVICVVLVYASGVPRAAWWGNLCMVILVLRMCVTLTDPHRIIHKGPVMITAVLLLAASYLQIALLDIFTYRFAREYRRYYAEYLANPGGQIYSGLVGKPWKSWWMMPTVNSDWNLYYSRAPELYGFDLAGNEMKLIPEQLRYVTADSGRPLGGNMKLREYDGHLFAPSDDKYASIVSADVDLGFIGLKDVDIATIPFISEKDGKGYVYVDLVFRDFEKRMFDIKGIYLTHKTD